MTLLSTAKKLLVEEAFELYQMRLEDIPVEGRYFRDHLENLADYVYEIERTKTFTDLIRKLEEGCFANLYYFQGEKGEDHLKVLLENIVESA